MLETIIGPWHIFGIYFHITDDAALPILADMPGFMPIPIGKVGDFLFSRPLHDLLQYFRLKRTFDRLDAVRDKIAKRRSMTDEEWL